MIRTLALTGDSQIKMGLSLKELTGQDIKWYWVDIEEPSDDEIQLLDTFFHFHPLSIEDCLHTLQRPKLDYYEAYNFLVLLVLNREDLIPNELDIFIGKKYVVTFHLMKLSEVNDAWDKIKKEKEMWDEGYSYIIYLILDKIVDHYFPAVQRIEDNLDELDTKVNSSRTFINQVFELRRDLLKLRKTVNSMRDLLYRLLNSSHMEEIRKNQLYFTDIYDHLLKLSDTIESNRDLTADMRDSYLSINSNRMNRIMVVLTVITTIFIPLTFISGVYGMNFEYMPELRWRYGYFAVLGVMIAIGLSMFIWFKRKGWFDFYK